MEVNRILRELVRHKMVDLLKKAQLFSGEFDFGGHVLTGGRRKPAPGKLMAVEKWILPSTISALRGFLGFANYYAVCVKGYAA